MFSRGSAPSSPEEVFDAQLKLAEKNRAAEAKKRSIILGVLTGRKKEEISSADFKSGLSGGRLFVTILGDSMALSTSDNASRVALARIKKLLRKNKMQFNDLEEIFGSAGSIDNFLYLFEPQPSGGICEIAFREAEINGWLVKFERGEQETEKSESLSQPTKRKRGRRGGKRFRTRKKKTDPESPLGDNEIVIPKFGKITFDSDDLILSAGGKKMTMCCDDVISEGILDRIKSLLKNKKMRLADLEQIFREGKGKVHVFISTTSLPGQFKIDFTEPAASKWLARFEKRSKPGFSEESIFLMADRLTVKLDDAGELVFRNSEEIWDISVLGDEGKKIWGKMLALAKSGTLKLSDFFARDSRMISGCSKRPRYQDYQISLDVAKARNFLQKFEN